MSLEDVKVDDWVWMSIRERSGVRRVRPYPVVDVTAQFLLVGDRFIDRFYKSTGDVATGSTSQYFISAIATPAEVSEWQAATEAAAREREQAREKQVERFKFLYLHLRDAGIQRLTCNGETAITFDYDGHRYEIREVAAHREE